MFSKDCNKDEATPTEPVGNNYARNKHQKIKNSGSISKPAPIFATPWGVEQEEERGSRDSMTEVRTYIGT